jgi:hypothetical protein
VTPMDWMLSDDTGVSSKLICQVMTGAQPLTGFNVGVPHDAGDFGRCYRLLRLFPHWRRRLPEVVALYPSWVALVREWDELTGMYEQFADPDGHYTREGYEKHKAVAERMYERMQVLIDEGRVADGWTKTGPGSWRKGERSRVRIGSNLSVES